MRYAGVGYVRSGGVVRPTLMCAGWHCQAERITPPSNSVASPVPRKKAKYVHCVLVGMLRQRRQKGRERGQLRAGAASHLTRHAGQQAGQQMRAAAMALMARAKATKSAPHASPAGGAAGGRRCAAGRAADQPHHAGRQVLDCAHTIGMGRGEGMGTCATR